MSEEKTKAVGVYLVTTDMTKAPWEVKESGPYSEVEQLRVWVRRATAENSELILKWCIVNEKGEEV